jgi:hypothetical protein
MFNCHCEERSDAAISRQCGSGAARQARDTFEVAASLRSSQ